MEERKSKKKEGFLGEENHGYYGLLEDIVVGEKYVVQRANDYKN